MAKQIAIDREQFSEEMFSTDTALRGYHLWTHASRLARAAFVALGLITLAWLVPWLPIGMDTQSYSPELGFSAFLLGSFAVTGILGYFFRWSAQRHMSRLAAWTELSRSLDGNSVVQVARRAASHGLGKPA